MTFDSPTTTNVATTTATEDRTTSLMRNNTDSSSVKNQASRLLEGIKSTPSTTSSDSSCSSSALDEHENHHPHLLSSSSSSSSSSTTTSTSSESKDQDLNANVRLKSLPPNRTITTTTTTTLPSISKDSSTCVYNQVLDDEIRSRLDKLNALSDLINSLEGQFDEANRVFTETLKCSADRLSSIAKTLGSKSIRQGRVYNAAKLSVEQSQSDCQRACVQFEQANKDHQIAKKAIKEAELKLREAAGQTANGVIPIPNISLESKIDFSKLHLVEMNDDQSQDTDISSSTKDQNHHSPQTNACDTNNIESSTFPNILDNARSDEDSGEEILLAPQEVCCKQQSQNLDTAQETFAQKNNDGSMENHRIDSSPTPSIKDATKLSEDLNQAIVRLIEAEKKRSQSERQHLDQANKLMIAQENLVRLERQHGQSIRRSQLYFDEAKRFNAKLSSVKGDISRIREEILIAKQAYAQTLRGLEQFSDDLHDSSFLTKRNGQTEYNAGEKKE